MKYDINHKIAGIVPDPPLDQLFPANTAFVRSSADFGPDVQFDLVVRYVDDIPGIDIDGYVELDSRLAWRPTTRVELFIVGRNLLDNQHAELAPHYIPTVGTEVQRSVYVGATWQF